MKNQLHSSIIMVSLTCLINVNEAPLAQNIVFTQPDNNLGLTALGGLMGFAWGDYDGDGDLDLLLCGSPSTLYRNDVSEESGFVQASEE